MKKKFLNIFLGMSLFSSLFMITATLAAAETVKPLLDDVGGKSFVGNTEANPNICDVIRVGLRLGQIIFYLTGVVVILSMIIGAFYWVSSAGDSGRVSEGKKIISAAFIGLIIVLLAYEIVGFTISVLMAGSLKQNDQVKNMEILGDNSSFKVWYNFSELLTECENAVKK